MSLFRNPSLILATAFAGAAYAQQPNVVLFMVDDFGWTDWQYDPVLNPTGSKLYETPNMLRLAQMGTNFTQSYAANAVCSPSRAAVMSGKDPARINITQWISGGNHFHPTLAEPDWDKTLNSSEFTLAEALRGDGYDTAFIGKWHLGSNGSSAADPTQHGFDINIGGNHKGSPPGGYFAGSDGSWSAPNIGTGFPSDAYLPDVLSDHAVQYIDDHNATSPDDPFFMFLSHYAVHNPQQAPADSIQYFQDKLNQGGDFGEHDRATYAAMIRHVDDSLGKVLDELEQENLLDETLIIFTSDHGGLWAAQGDPTSNAPLRGGKGSYYEGGVRTPLIVANPGNAQAGQGVLNDSIVIGHDIYTTVLDITNTPGNAAHNAQTDGVSFAVAVEGGTVDRGAIFWHYPHTSDQDNGSALVTGGTFVSAVRKGDWKLIFFYESRTYELYNLAEDLSETNDVFEQNSIAAELSTLLRNHLFAIDAQLPISKATGQEVALPDQVVDSTFDLFYDAQTGELIVDTNGEDLHGYLIEGAGFIEENHTAIMSNGSLTSSDTELAEGSLTPISGVLSLGAVLPSNLTESELSAIIGPNSRYVGDLGTAQVNFELLYTANPIDLDGDGDVDDADFGLAFAAFTGPNNGPSSNPSADLDGDGDVDDADFGLAFAAFTGPRAAVNVPEPASLALLGLGGLMITRRRLGYSSA